MNYSVPKQKEFFYFATKTNKTGKINHWFSRETKDKLMNQFIEKINKYGKLYQSIPFVKEIFLCNSISFNTLKRDSDIDIFIITKKNSIRRARFFSAIFFKLLWIKRSMKNKKQKFCLSFYITEDHKNLYPIIIEKTDIYLTYRLAHLVPLYQESLNKNSLFIKNKRFKELMPNHPEEYCITIWNKIFTWKSKIKKWLEFIFWWTIGHILEKIIKFIRLPILLNKIKKLWPSWKQIVINDEMLKFHNDIRDQIHLLYKIAQKQ